MILRPIDSLGRDQSPHQLLRVETEDDGQRCEPRFDAIHPKAMPVILTTPKEVETWMTAPQDEALKLQRPLPDSALRTVARGVKEDPAGLVI